MSNNSPNWVYIAEARVWDDANRITIPEAVTNEAEIVHTADDAVWSYDRSGLVVLSNRKLVDKSRKYKYIDSNFIDENRGTYVPGRFFPDFGGHRGPIDEQDTTYEPEFTYGQKVFFAGHEGMASRETQSCYVLTQKQLTDIMDGRDFGTTFDSPPRFI